MLYMEKHVDRHVLVLTLSQCASACVYYAKVVEEDKETYRFK